MTLAVLAERSGVSRATLSRIENAEVSPTAETLGRLATVYALPISRLLTPLDQGFRPVLRRDEQAVWRDRESAFLRRMVSPPSGPLSAEIIQCELGAQQQIAYAAPAVPGQEHHLYILDGHLSLTVEDKTYDLQPGDCLRYILFGETLFRTTRSPCTYLLVLP